MAKVYLVTRGSYSDYRVVTAFTTEEEAKRFCEVMNKYGNNYSYGEDYEVEEYDLFEKVEDYKPQDQEETYIEIDYNSREKKIDIRISRYSYEEDFELYFINPNYHSLSKHIPFTLENLKKAEKIMQDKVAEVEYRIQHEFGGDLKKFEEYHKAQEKEYNEIMPF